MVDAQCTLNDLTVFISVLVFCSNDVARFTDFYRNSHYHHYKFSIKGKLTDILV